MQWQKLEKWSKNTTIKNSKPSEYVNIDSQELTKTSLKQDVHKIFKNTNQLQLGDGSTNYNFWNNERLLFIKSRVL